MACKSYLLLLALIVMSVCVSALRPLGGNHESPSLAPKPSQINSDGKLKVVSESKPPEIGGGIWKVDGTSLNDEGGKLKVDGTAPRHGSLKGDGASLIDEGGKLKVDGTSPSHGSLNVDASEHLPSPHSNGRGGNLKFDGTPSGSLGAIGLIPGISLVPGGGGTFHFALGPIDLGGNIGWGAVAPGYAVTYSQPQPYVVVSPYSSVYGEPAPVSGHDEPAPVSGYGQPASVVGFGSPAGYGPQPPVGGYGPQQPVVQYSSPTPVAAFGPQPPVVQYSSPTPVAAFGPQPPVDGYGEPSPSSNRFAPPVPWSGHPSQGFSSSYESVRGNGPSSPQN